MLTTAEAVSRYARLVIRFGVDSPRVLQYVRRHADVPDFVKYADALRGVRKHLAEASTTATDRSVPVNDRWEC